MFAGQGSVNWSRILEDACADAAVSTTIDDMVRGSYRVLAPVATQLLAAGREDSGIDAVSSVPGIIRAQVAQLAYLDRIVSLADHQPQTVLGHSQGVLAARIAQAYLDHDADGMARYYALARIIGAAASLTARMLGADVCTADGSPMLSVKGVAQADIERITGTAAAVVNAWDHVVFSGLPASMTQLSERIAGIRRHHEREIALYGGAPFEPVVEFLQVAAPFHSPLMKPAVDRAVTWAAACGLDQTVAREIAERILTVPEHWDTQVDAALESGARWFVDLGPGSVLGDMTARLIEGSGAGVIDAGDPAACDHIGMPDYAPKPGADWSAFAPKLITLPDGRTVVDTAFTRLTGRSVIMLGGMTPTTVDPAIVAAAANAGHWAELAGGGQVTKDIFFDHMSKLHEQLKPGMAVQFNAMFMNPTLWKLHFGVKRIVSKARAAGAPIDGVTISAGVPERDEAVSLVKRLNNEGFLYVSLKVGTAKQIRQVLGIADDLHADEATKTTRIILQVEDGRGGGHHSWESLDAMLLGQYAAIRRRPNIVLAVGGGFGTPDKAARYITGAWSARYGLRAMPVDAVFVGTVAMTAKEARTNPDVKQALVAASGTGRQSDAAASTWVRRGHSAGGVASGISSLHADLYELENSAAACGRLLTQLTEAKDIDKAVAAHRDEIIAALNKTAKPYFGDVAEMTYAAWLRRYVELAWPWADATYADRFEAMVRRCEQRFVDLDHGEFTPVIDLTAAAGNPQAVIAAVEREYPLAARATVADTDVAWFTELCDGDGKPVPFVPVIDAEVSRRWGTDAMWQSQDPRYTADQVIALPGPLSVSAIDRVNEPVGDLLDRFEAGCVDALEAAHVTPVAAIARRADSRTGELMTTPEQVVCSEKLVEQYGHLTAGLTSRVKDRDAVRFEAVPGADAPAWQVTVALDNMHWDAVDDGADHYAVRRLVRPISFNPLAANGAYPLVEETLLLHDMMDFLSSVAGEGQRDVCGNLIAMPKPQPSERSPFGELHRRLHVDDLLGAQHYAATIGHLPADMLPAQAVPDALMCLMWPSIYAAETSGHSDDGISWLESLQFSVHLNHEIRIIDGDTFDILLDRYRTMEAAGRKPYLDAVSWADRSLETANGRTCIIHAEVTLRCEDDDAAAAHGTIELTERFICPRRVYADAPAPVATPYGGLLAAEGERELPASRRLLRRFHVTAPSDMTAFAQVSGDYNPLHSSRIDAQTVGYDMPIVHGMWLSAVAQHAVSALNTLDGSQYRIEGWTYSMFAPVQLGDDIEISVERIGRASNGRTLLEVVCKVGDLTVSRARAIAKAPTTAYVFPGQGSQRKGMGLDDLSRSAAARKVWERADKHTRNKLGFSILDIVRDNPPAVVVKGVEYRHPDGVLFLSQFTQVALTVLGFAQFAKLQAEHALVWDDSYLAGHSLGEYTALSVVGHAFSLETVIDMVYLRGNTMYELVDRDETGRSNYGMGALRPVQFGISDDDEVDAYVRGLSERYGEFLQIVNYNVSGSQYAVVGTLRGLEILKKDAERRAREYGGKPPYMPIPGIDVPFHSRMMRPGVPKYREKLEAMIPEDQDCQGLVGRYIPNLVARPFALTREFAEAILEVAPSRTVKEALATDESWSWWQKRPQQLSRMLFIELLAWQFASPVRWIETQRLLFTPKNRGGLGVGRFVEIGLAAAPVLANMAAKTLKLPEFADAHVQVLNAERDGDRLLGNDTDPAPGVQEDAPAAADVAEDNVAVAGGDAAAAAAPAAPTAAVPAASAPAAPVTAAPAGPAPDLPFTAADAVKVLLTLENKILPDQIGASDTLETLTNGVSSKRNQQLVDIAAEISVPSLEGAAEADMATLVGMVNHAAGGYKPFGSVLQEATTSGVHELFGAAHVPLVHVGERLKAHWGLDGGWTFWTLAELLLGSRDGSSLRGGELRTLTGIPAKTAAAVDALIDEAVQAVAKAHDIAIAPVAGTAAAGGGMVDSAALDAYKASVTGPDGVLATAARDVLHRLGLNEPATPADDDEARANAAVVALVEKELGSDWFKRTKPSFDARKAVLFDDRWASAREDLARLRETAGTDADEVAGSFVGAGKPVADQARWWAAKSEHEGLTDLAARYRRIAVDAENDAATLPYDGKVALITGATPRSIAGAVAARFLSGGATVIITASHIDWKRLQFARDVYRTHAAGDARLWLVPANLSSYQDVDALVEWVTSEQKRSIGADSILLKPALMPDFFIPFAAPHVSGMLDQVGPAAEQQMRLLLWSVERGIADLAHAREDVDVAHRTMVVLPGSGNRGVFGGDGAYGEAKNAFDAIERKWKSEPTWHGRILLAQPTIGWVRGTGLMAQNDPLVKAVEAKGVRTYSTDEIAEELMKLTTPESFAAAAKSPIHANLTGGVGEVDVDLAQVTSQFIEDFRKQQQEAKAAAAAAAAEAEADGKPATLKALPAPATAEVAAKSAADRVAAAEAWDDVRTDLDDMVVIVGTGLIGPWGSGRTAAEAELGIRYDGTADMTTNGVIELAWSMGLITWQDKPKAGWVDANGDLIDETDIYERFHDEVVARCGVRELVKDAEIDPSGDETLPVVYLDKDVNFNVPDREQAEAYLRYDPENTVILPDETTGEWTVIRKAGSKVRVPRRRALLRHVGAQIPDGFDPSRWGLPADMMESLDEVSLWSLFTAVDAFLASGFTPAEILQTIHPADFASTQSTGIGGARSQMTMFEETLGGHDIPPDLFAEIMPNIIGGHVMQSYLGGYGEINTPIGACATAAVSLEEGVDKIALHKADFVVTGGSDDISRGSVYGFGNMSATADDAELAAAGVDTRFMSRPDDRRRAGFIESQGGGTVLIARASLALRLGLPVLGVVGYARTFADGAHASIPAPGMGALAAARGGRKSQLVRQLADLGLTADDITVVCKHDTSTNANDANESEIHRRIAHAIGRTTGNPLFVFSPKALTGHAKGGSFVFQTADIMRMFRTGLVPANMSLDCVDPTMSRDDELVWVRNKPLDLAAAGIPVRSVIATSLGFGHVSSVVVFVSPVAFEAAVLQSGDDADAGRALLDTWLERSAARLVAGARRLDAGRHGHAPLYEPIENRHFAKKADGVGAAGVAGAGVAGAAADPHETEAAMLLDPDARLGADGLYH
ncbi:type I polyketide synthase [Bifidobacterium leontopitheci]|uniref:3-oxoacyl-(Acyl-carrier-protein) synthase n=1 Tax=Bifidobacterium leontopitheci TaxID=2650774 RepID=A0A6I1GFN4_9BIFI|nr:type I polyketide synthase [Bifidobacterium leontopitheci]KAB7790460.1 3-oxoacyl-(acyl-carrier-protein) synthase [Bifidobacterium leontopitheci]